MCLGQEYQPSDAEVPFPRWYHGLPAARHLSWARFGRLVLILHLYHNYTSCIASSSLDYIWLTCQHVINSLVRICFQRLHGCSNMFPSVEWISRLCPRLF